MEEAGKKVRESHRLKLGEVVTFLLIDPGIPLHENCSTSNKGNRCSPYIDTSLCELPKNSLRVPGMVRFRYEKKEFVIFIEDVLVYPQCYGAIVDLHLDSVATDTVAFTVII